VVCTVVLPRQVRIRQGLVPGAEITLVACDPDYQKQGYGGSTVRDALRYMAETGLALGLLYGHAEYYPRFGYVPVLPSLTTALAVGAIGERAFSQGGSTFSERSRRDSSPIPDLPHATESCESWPPSLVPAVEADYPALSALYDVQLGIYPCSVARSADPWIWQVGDPEQHLLLTLTDRRGYVYIAIPRDQTRLWVHEGAAKDEEAARQLLAGLTRIAQDKGLPEIQMSLPPDHPMVRMALLYGATQSYRPAIHGMAAVALWEPLLPPGYRVVEAMPPGSRPSSIPRPGEAAGPGTDQGRPVGVANQAPGLDQASDKEEAPALDQGLGLRQPLWLMYEGRLAWQTDRQALTELITGYRGIDNQPGAATLHEDDRDLLRRDFPQGFPKLTYEPFFQGG
jgi:hypothetical protein